MYLVSSLCISTLSTLSVPPSSTFTTGEKATCVASSDGWLSHHQHTLQLVQKVVAWLVCCLCRRRKQPYLLSTRCCTLQRFTVIVGFLTPHHQSNIQKQNSLPSVQERAICSKQFQTSTEMITLNTRIYQSISATKDHS